MGFVRRLGWYLVGLSIGIVFLVFFFKKKSDETGTEFCYFPNCRVLKDMRSKTLVFGDDLPEKYRDTLLIRTFLTDGDIDFGKSDTKSEPCKTYYIQHTVDSIELVMEMASCPNKVVVKSASPSD